MLENTKENKAKFFALHWGQNLQWDITLPIQVNQIFDLVNPRVREDDVLVLKPISQISDEDAAKVAMIENDYTDPVLRGKSLVDIIQRDYVRFKPSVMMDIADFLRSRGHALPWAGLSVETLVEYGWVKLKGVNE